MKPSVSFFALAIGASATVFGFAQAQTTPGAVPSGNVVSSAKAPIFNVIVTDGQLQLRAQRQEANGLLRNVTLHRPTSRSSTDASDVTFGVDNAMRIFAQYARRDASRPGEWLLGKGVIQHFRPDGTLLMEAKFERFHAQTIPDKEDYFNGAPRKGAN